MRTDDTMADGRRRAGYDRVPERAAAVALRNAWLGVPLIPIGYVAAIFFILTIRDASGYGLSATPSWFGWLGLIILLLGCLGPLLSILAYARTATRGGRTGSAPIAAGVVMVLTCWVLTRSALNNLWLPGA